MEGYDEDIGPTHLIQLLHKTAKDFLTDHKAAGPLSFCQYEADEFVTQALSKYVMIVLPTQSMLYSPFPARVSKDLDANITDIARYLNDKVLLSFALEALRSLQKKPVQPIITRFFEQSLSPPLSEVDDEVLNEFFRHEKRIPFHISQSRFSLLPPRSADLERCLLFTRYLYRACLDGLLISVETLLTISDSVPLWSVTRSHHRQTLLCGALLAAIDSKDRELVEDVVIACRRYSSIYQGKSNLWFFLSQAVLGGKLEVVSTILNGAHTVINSQIPLSAEEEPSHPQTDSEVREAGRSDYRATDYDWIEWQQYWMKKAKRTAREITAESMPLQLKPNYMGENQSSIEVVRECIETVLTFCRNPRLGGSMSLTYWSRLFDKAAKDCSTSTQVGLTNPLIQPS